MRTGNILSKLGTPSAVAASASAVALLAEHTARLNASIYNDSTADLYILAGQGTVSASLFTVKLAAGGYWEVPQGYVGPLSGLWSSATGNARITEYS